LRKINQHRSKTFIAYWKKEIIIEAFNEARPCRRALFLLREYLFSEIFLDPFPFVNIKNPSQTVAMNCCVDG